MTKKQFCEKYMERTRKGYRLEWLFGLGFKIRDIDIKRWSFTALQNKYEKMLRMLRNAFLYSIREYYKKYTIKNEYTNRKNKS